MLRIRTFERGAGSRLRSNGVADSHDRVVPRRVCACEDAAGLAALSEWPGLQSVVGAQAIRTVKGESETNAETRYFLSRWTLPAPLLSPPIGTMPS